MSFFIYLKICCFGGDIWPFVSHFCFDFSRFSNLFVVGWTDEHISFFVCPHSLCCIGSVTCLANIRLVVCHHCHCFCVCVACLARVCSSGDVYLVAILVHYRRSACAKFFLLFIFTLVLCARYLALNSIVPNL